MLSHEALKKVENLVSNSIEFVLAIVVRTEGPTSAKPGSWAVIYRDGTLEGWIGGSCVKPSVVDKAKQLFSDNTPLLMKFSPDADPALSTPGVEEVPMTCSSEGIMDIYLEPYIKKNPLLIIGNSPIVGPLARLGKMMLLNVTVVTPPEYSETATDADEVSSVLEEARIDDRTFVVVATHQNFPMLSDAEILEKIVESDARYIGFVSSRKRASSVLRQMIEDGVESDKVDKIRSPAGISLGSLLNPEEIALSVISEIVGIIKGGKFTPIEAARAKFPSGKAAHAAIEKARDLVCGMQVKVESAKYVSEYNGSKYYFCSPICKKEFDQDQEKFIQV